MADTASQLRAPEDASTADDYAGSDQSAAQTVAAPWGGQRGAAVPKLTCVMAPAQRALSQVMKGVHPNAGINTAAMEMLCWFLSKIAVSMSQIAEEHESVEDIIRAALGGDTELAKHACAEYVRTRDRAENREPLDLSIVCISAALTKLFEQFSPAGRVGIAAVIEYLAAELCELGGSVALNFKLMHMKPCHLKLAIFDDHDLLNLWVMYN
jgi:hypothetical protein